MIIYAKLQCSHVRHQYGIFGGKSQTSFLRNATRAGSKEGRLFSQARDSEAPSTKILLLKMAVKLRLGVDENADEWDTHTYILYSRSILNIQIKIKNKSTSRKGS